MQLKIFEELPPAEKMEKLNKILQGEIKLEPDDKYTEKDIKDFFQGLGK